MRADGRHPLTPLPGLDRRRRRVAAEPRGGRDRGRERRSRLGREPEPRRGRRAALLPERRGAAGGARVRIPHGQPRTCRGCVRGGGGGGRAGVRRARRRAEAGEAAKPTTERLARRARELGATLLGPNCMGFFVPGGAAAWNGRPQDTTAPGHVAVLCQSGSIADAFLSLGGRIGLRCVVSSGAEAVTDAADFLAFFAEDPGTRAVGLFLETVRRPDAFVDALRRCAEAGKPVVCLKVGRSEAAARAALSHTGALVGSDRAFSAVLRRYSRDRGRRLPRARRDARDPRP